MSTENANGKKVATLDQIINIFTGIQSIEENTKLEFKVSYRLGKLSDKCRSFARAFEKAQQKRKIEINKEITALQKGFSKKNDEEKEEIKLKIRELNENFQMEVEDMLSKEEEIDVPEFKLSDFEGKEVSQKFMNLLAPWIKE